MSSPWASGKGASLFLLLNGTPEDKILIRRFTIVLMNLQPIKRCLLYLELFGHDGDTLLISDGGQLSSVQNPSSISLLILLVGLFGSMDWTIIN